MPDMMMFPKTVDEFMEQYKIVDADEVYTNGAELVPIFRMKQWFEHIDAESVRHGHWIEKSKVYPDFPYDSTYNYECSNCGYTDTHGADVEVPYCWHCGAKMDAPTQKSVGNALEALDRWKKEPEINPCRGCEDYDGKGGCLSHGGCGEGREDG